MSHQSHPKPPAPESETTEATGRPIKNGDKVKVKRKGDDKKHHGKVGVLTVLDIPGNSAEVRFGKDKVVFCFEVDEIVLVESAPDPEPEPPAAPEPPAPAPAPLHGIQ